MSVDYARFFQSLCGAGVEFILVGGTAANVHGSARLTQDVDLVYRRSRENVARLAAALAPFSPYLRGAPQGLPFRWDAAGRPKDLEVIAELEALLEETGRSS